MELIHHGAAQGVTGSCHEVVVAPGLSLLVDCGLRQGLDAPAGQGADDRLGFDASAVQALIVTHVHIDHVGRIPALLASGFTGPIYATPASVLLLPLTLEDASSLRSNPCADLELRLRRQLVAVPYGQWQPLPAGLGQLRFQHAGHILGSALVELDLPNGERWVFSGDLGAPDTPLLPDPVSPERADLLVIESTYGDRNHQGRAERGERLRQIIERTLRDGGTTLIPAFAIGRTQELLYEFEQILHQFRGSPLWRELPIIVDSPLAARFTHHYRRLAALWDEEARQRLQAGRHPLSFAELITIDDHRDHLALVNRLAQSGEPAVVIAGSGMCNGGRIMNYLNALLGDARTDLLFVGYQADGTPGRMIADAEPGQRLWLDGAEICLAAQVHQLSGFSAHADRDDLLRFVRQMATPPKAVRVVHGEPQVQQAFARQLRQLPGIAAVSCGCDG